MKAKCMILLMSMAFLTVGCQKEYDCIKCERTYQYDLLEGCIGLDLHEATDRDELRDIMEGYGYYCTYYTHTE